MAKGFSFFECPLQTSLSSLLLGANSHPECSSLKSGPLDQNSGGKDRTFLSLIYNQNCQIEKCPERNLNLNSC